MAINSHDKGKIGEGRGVEGGLENGGGAGTYNSPPHFSPLRLPLHNPLLCAPTLTPSLCPTLTSSLLYPVVLLYGVYGVSSTGV